MTYRTTHLIRALLLWAVISTIVIACFVAGYYTTALDGTADRLESQRLDTVQKHLQERARRKTEALEKCLHDFGPGAAFYEYPDGTWRCSDHRSGKIANKLL